MKTVFEIKTREQVSSADQVLFDAASKMLGFVPNMYGMMANSETALARYVKAENWASTLEPIEAEVICLVVSQVNDCAYCLSYHSANLEKSGFRKDQIIEMRKGGAPFDLKLDALIKLSKSITEKRGHTDSQLIDDFIDAGYSKATVMDAIFVINLRSITNHIFNATGGFAIDFPPVPAL